MKARKDCIVHIGFHKTGTTSIQHFLSENRPKLRSLGIEFYSGRHSGSNHLELHAAAMRNERTSTFKERSGVVIDEAYRSSVAEGLDQFAAASGDRKLLFSAEGLSLLRYEDETARLAELLPGPAQIVAYLREPDAYLKSYTGQLKKDGIVNSADRNSYAYVQPDTWLVNYEERLASYRRTFGAENVILMDYDNSVREDGTVIASFLRFLGVFDAFPPDQWKSIRLNQSPREDPK